MTRESRQVGTMAAQNLGAEIASIVAPTGTQRKPSARTVATVHLDRLTSAHDIGAELWYRTVMLKPGTTVRLEVGRVWPPRYLPDVRVDLAYAIDSDRGDVADAWLDCLERAVAMAVVLA